jgi:hypothetical protein
MMMYDMDRNFRFFKSGSCAADLPAAPAGVNVGSSSWSRSVKGGVQQVGVCLVGSGG